MSIFMLEENDLRQRLAEAYESGWNGIKELKDDVVNGIIDDMKEQRTKDFSSTTLGWNNTSVQFSGIDHAIETSSYSTDSLPLHWTDENDIQI